MRAKLLVTFASTAIFVFIAAACDDTAPSNGTVPVTGTSSGGVDGGPGGKKDSGSCPKDTCESVSGACGEHDDKCGGKFSCGTCPPATPCTPATCEKLSQTCGIHDDACGSTVNCGACATTCDKDTKEPNDKKEQATDLGEANDYDNQTKSVAGLKTSDGDEDWFKIHTVDGGFGGNPLITALVTDATLEVSVFHVCESQPDYSYCNDAAKGKQDDLVGKGCRALGSVALATDCKGFTETGTTYIRVRKTATDTKCQQYDLTVKIE